MTAQGVLCSVSGVGETIYIIDGHSQMYRAYYAPFRDLTSPAGEPTRATYVFCSMLLKFISEQQPKYLAMAVDSPTETLLRRRMYPEYKVTRKPMPEDLPPQIERILQIVGSMGIPILQVEGYEADDIIATAAERLAKADSPLIAISRDKDLEQLIGDSVKLYDPMKDEVIDADAVVANRGHPPEKVVDALALAGDTSDNVPGVPGVGPKTAAKLLAEYGSAEEIIARADELSPKLAQKVRENAETIKLSRQLVTLERDVPVETDLSAWRFNGIKGDAIRPIFAELGFNRLLEQLDHMGAGGGDTANTEDIAAKAGRTSAEDFSYRCINTPEGLRGLADELRGVGCLAVDTETTSTNPMFAELVGLSLSWRPGEAVYLPVKAPLGATTLDVADVRKHLGPVLADEGVEKVGHNIKFDMIVLDRAGMPLTGRLFDTMVAAWVLDSSRVSYKLDTLAAELLNHQCVPIGDLIGRGRDKTTINLVPLETVSDYAAEDADVTLRLSKVLRKQLSDEGLSDLMDDMEMPLLPVLTEMEMTGILVDPAALKRMETDLSARAEKLRDRIVSLAGRQFNPDSPKQLAEVLFEDLKLPVLKRTKTGASTDSSVLEQLAVTHELPALVLDYRKLTKLLGTYLKALAGCIHPETRRVHTCFHQTGTATGRLSSSDPNLQNIPIRTEEGRRIRSAFVADEGYVLLSADYSQVELRVLAHLCEDETLLAAFRAGRDIHRTVAGEVFGIPENEVTDQQRARAKTVNFGIIYGQTAHGLSTTLRIPRKEAEEFIRKYRGRFPRIDEFLRQCVQVARDNGYVRTMFGRRRRITNMDSRNPQRRALAERLAINSVVQGSAADIIKRAMVNIARRIREQDRPSRMLLQIHDELVFETPAEALDAEREMVVTELSGAADLKVPLKVDVGVGGNWMEAK
ncbi:MAG: DNA polymerase I [Phycisphaerae bacterium]